jgi:hypothetical protein
MLWLVLLTGIACVLALWGVVSAIRTPGLVRRLRRLLAAAVFTGLGMLGGSILILLQLFHAFVGEALVAHVTTRRLLADEFELTYTPLAALRAHQARAGAPGAKPIRIRLRGDQWAISGGIVKWHPWLTVLGVPSYHKPMRLAGHFSDVAKQRAHPPTVHALEPTADRIWEALYRADPYLPFVDAVYGSAAYVYVEPNSVQEIYVTPSGYLIKRAQKKSP